jgi:hypothetical protein
LLQGVEGNVELLGDELAADVVVVGQTADTAARLEAIQGGVETLAGSHGVRGTGGLGARSGYNAHGLASGRSRFC